MNTKPHTQQKLWQGKLATLVLVGLALALALQSPLAMQGAREGLLLCGRALIPSLYPFMVLCGLYAHLANQRAHTQGGWLWALFRLPKSALGVLLLGLLGGYPLGAKAAAQLYEGGQLTQSQAGRLQLFCVSAGPAFVLGAVAALLGNRRAGWILLVSLLGATLLLGFATRLFASDEAPPTAVPQGLHLRWDEIVLQAVSQATTGMLHICAWVVFWAAVCALLRLLPPELWGVLAPLSALLEVSSGLSTLIHGGATLPLLCAVLGFGGLSVHCQLLGDLRKTKVRLLHFFVFRLLHGALAAALCSFVLRYVAPEAASVAALGQGRVVQLWAVSAPAAALALLFCSFMILEGRARA